MLVTTMKLCLVDKNTPENIIFTFPSLSTSSSKILCVTNLMLKQFVFCIMSNLTYWNFNVFAFSVVVATRLAHHHHRIYYRPKVSSLFFFPWVFIYRWFGNNVCTSANSDCFYKTTNRLWI